MFKKILIIICLYYSFLTLSKAEIIDSINVIGNDRVSKNTIINFSELQSGSDISENDLNNALNVRYKRTSLFRI